MPSLNATNVGVGLVALLVTYLWFGGSSHDERGSNLTERIAADYDYIIVGAGSTGCVVASRLSEDPNVRVLLLEAGGDDRGISNIRTPGLSHLGMHAEYDWEYYTVPQKHGLRGYDQKRAFWPRGKALGGTSNLYSMVAIRGDKRDYNRWEKEYGAKGWSYDDVLPFFKKSEQMTDPTLAKSSYHGTSGPIKISVPNTMPLTNILMESGKELGLEVTDPNGEKMEGLSLTQSHSYKGVRGSSSRYWIHPIMDRPNLDVVLNAHVTKIVIENKKTVGVDLIRNNRKTRVKVNREVIVSGGSIGSPQMLMLSGIGPKKHLQEMGIPVIADLPVGENLHDHLFFEYSIALNTTVSATQAVQDSWWTKFKLDYLGGGVLSSSHYVEVQVFDYTDAESKKLQWPDLQIMFHQTPWTVENLRGFGYSEDTLKESEHRRTHTDMFACESSLLRPLSRGSIRLVSSDPFDYPLIDPNYLSRQEDVDQLVRGIQYCKKFLTVSPLQRLGAVHADKPNRFCKEHTFDTDPYWECMVRQRIHTIYHPVGTCRMGGEGRKEAVVDPQLRVQGISGLRVADASIMPFIISGNTHTPCVMIGEKAAHMVQEAWRK